MLLFLFSHNAAFISGPDPPSEFAFLVRLLLRYSNSRVYLALLLDETFYWPNTLITISILLFSLL